jgi:hypothetical protein
MAALIPHLTHLEPPSYAGPISLERFSPNYDFADRFGFTNVSPHPAYRHLYPFDIDSVTKLARRFVFDYREPQNVDRYAEPLAIEVAAWQKSYDTSDLFFADLGAQLQVWDLRPGAPQPLTVLTGVQRQLYLACDACRPRDELSRLAAASSQGPISRSLVDETLAPLVSRGLMVSDGESFLSLAIPLGDYSPSDTIADRFDRLVNEIAATSSEIVLLATDRTDQAGVGVLR